MENEMGYYWAYRKGSPVPEIVFVFDGVVYEIFIETYKRHHGPDGERPVLEAEDLSEMKWILGEKVQYDVLP